MMIDVLKRIQRSRTKGWRMPKGAVYVGRGTPWGNHAIIRGPALDRQWWVSDGPNDGDPTLHPSRYSAHEKAVCLYRDRLMCDIALVEQVKIALRGRVLACWCPLDFPCHADVLLEMANRE